MHARPGSAQIEEEIDCTRLAVAGWMSRIGRAPGSSRTVTSSLEAGFEAIRLEDLNAARFVPQKCPSESTAPIDAFPRADRAD